MSAMTEAIRLVISGDSKGAVKALGDVQTQAEKTGGAFGKYGEGLNKASNYAAAGAVVGAAIIAKSVIDTQKAGSAIKELMRMTGDSVEEASRLTGQWGATGLSIEEGSVAMKKFSQNLAAVYNGTASEDPFGALGVSVVDSNGQMRDSAAVLADVQAAMSALDNPTQRTSVALQMFGKSGDDLLNWLTKTPAELDELNRRLADAGAIWSPEDLQQYKDAAAAQRDLKIALTGIEKTIANEVVPALTPFVQLIGSLLRFLRPLAPVIVPLTAALAVFVGVVKGVMAVQKAAGAVRGLATAMELSRLKVSGAMISLVEWIAKVPALIAANVGLAASYTAVGIAAAAAGFAIYEAIDAYMQWQDAVAQAKGATDDAAAENQRAYDSGAITRAQYLSNAAAIDRDAYKKPWYMTSPLPGFASGGDFITRGATPIMVGEDGAERVTITPLSKGGGRSALHVHFHGTVVGGKRAARELALLLGEELRIAEGGLA